MYTIRKYLNKVAEFLSIGSMALLVLLVTWQVVTRYVFNNPSTWTEQTTRYMFVWVVLINAAYVFGKRGHMNISYVWSKLPPTLQTATSIFTETVTLLFVVGVLTVGGFYAVQLAMPQMDSALPIKMGMIYLALPLSGLLSSFYTICNIHDIIVEHKQAVGKGDQHE